MYIYVLAVSGKNYPPSVTPGPVYGAYTSEKKCHAHMDSIRNERVKRGCTILYDYFSKCEYSGEDFRRVGIEAPNGERENFVLVRFKNK